MGYIKFLKSKKIIILAISVVIVAGITGLIFYTQRLPTYKLSIKFSELSPFVSHQQARATICDTMKGQLFDEVCQDKFDSVGKNDAKKIGALFSLLKKVENNRRISDYERLLIAQAIFSSLPTKDSPLAQYSGSSVLLVKLKNFISKKNIVYAKESSSICGESITNTEESAENLEAGEAAFKKRMLSDLKEAMNNLPEVDNAWVMNVTVSQYGWINGERQPIYSEEYVESFNPYPGISTEDKSKWEEYDLTHIRSYVGAFATNQEMYSGPLKEGSGKMIAYSFTIGSWRSVPYGEDSVLVLAEAGPAAYDYDNRHHLTEENYKGEDLLSNLLRVAKIPDRQQSAKNAKKKSEPSEKLAQTAWGSVDDWETAYETYFWMHLQSPDRNYGFWGLYYNDQEAPGRALRDRPLGEPVNLRAYFNTPGVKEEYECIRERGVNIPPLDEFLNNIDAYQANLELGKPAEEKAVEEEKWDDNTPAEVEYRRWLDCIARKDSTPGLKCHD